MYIDFYLSQKDYTHAVCVHVYKKMKNLNFLTYMYTEKKLYYN